MSTKFDKYLLKVTPERHPILAEMERYARENHFPIVGPLVGRLLYQLALAVKARKLLELGSGYGYSAFWLSLAVGRKGHITMTDKREQNKRRAYDYFKKAGLQSQFDFRVTDALQALKKLSGPYDLIFNDIDKDSYPETIDPAAQLLRKGGLFVTDNVFLSGRILDKDPDKTARAVLDFTNRLYQDSRFFTTLIPLRDGLSVAVRA